MITNMERTLALLLGISFALIALFGFSVASATMNGAHVGCVADVFQELQGSACPVSGSPFSLLASHLSSLRGFVGNTSVGFLMFLAFAMLAFTIAAPRIASPLFSFVRISDTAVPRGFAKRIRWTALHETSPTAAY